MLTFLINDILDFAQLRSSKFRKVSSQFDIKEAIDEMINVLKFKADSMSISVTTDFANFDRNHVDGDMLNSLAAGSSPASNGSQIIRTDQQRVQ